MKKALGLYIFAAAVLLHSRTVFPWISDPETGFSSFQGAEAIEDSSMVHRRQKRLFFGTEAKAEDWPFFATLFKNGKLHCGATILREDIAMTAGKCFEEISDDNLKMYEIHAGITECNDVKGAEQIVSISEVRRSGVFTLIKDARNLSMPNNDIIILKLKPRLTFNLLVNNVALPAKGTAVPSIGAMCKLAGCSITSFPEIVLAKSIHELKIELVSDKVCNEDTTRMSVDLLTQFCAKNPEFRGPFREDLGGPLVCYTSGGKATVYGIISWVKRCNTQLGCSVVLTRIPNQIIWIGHRLVELCDNCFNTPELQQ